MGEIRSLPLLFSDSEQGIFDMGLPAFNRARRAAAEKAAGKTEEPEVKETAEKQTGGKKKTSSSKSK